MLDTLTFDNAFTRELPGDPETRNFTRQVRGACWSRVAPQPSPQPRLVGYAREVGELIGLDDSVWKSREFLDVFSGSTVLAGMEPFAMCYGGHQFGTWAGQLGDGRAINLGEVAGPRGRWTLQLKGSGPTPYSRHADGWAVLRSSVREFLCSEAMHHLGVPTTRALCVIASGRTVMRDMFYDGRPKPEPGAVVCRVAPSFTRFGNFEILASRNESALLTRLIEHTIRQDFPQLGAPDRPAMLAWFDEICRSTARMIVDWMRVGFVHGVMNTDNMSVLGLTIDYGPYGWLEDFDPAWTPNTTDANGRRYCYGNQPQIALWNLTRLGMALSTVIDEPDALDASLSGYARAFERGWAAALGAKLGIADFDDEADQPLADELSTVLRAAETDVTLFYRDLAKVTGEVSASDAALVQPLADAFYKPEELAGEHRARLAAWLRKYLARARRDGREDGARREAMDRVNPRYVLRNYLAQLAIDKAEQGDAALVGELLEVLRRPYDEQPGKEEFARKRPEWARHRAGCSMLSCSS